MPSPYFQKALWIPFNCQNQVFSLSHLDEHEFAVVDSKKVERYIAVTYTDHCFTQEFETGIDTAWKYPGSSRKDGYFCLERYMFSLSLPRHIMSMESWPVWNVEGAHYAFLPTQTDQGEVVTYVIIFSLDKVKGLPVQLHMQVSTAYPCHRDDLVTHGSVRFPHLVTLRMDKKTPPRNTSSNRKRPPIFTQKK